MKQITTAAILLVLAIGQAGADETETLLQDLHQRAGQSMAMVQCSIKEELGARSFSGVGVCIEGSGLLMTQALDSRIRPDTITSLEVVLPGVNGKTLPAKLLGIDPLTGLSFVQATQPHPWEVVSFLKNSNLRVGELVGSAGLLLNDPTHPPVVGAAYVASELRAPAETALVTGGRLTGVGSVVFNKNGRAIGIVSNQPYLRYTMPSGQGVMNLALRNDDQAITFLPVEEFVFILEKIPQDGQVRRLPWIGVGAFQPLSDVERQANNVQTPAVRIDRVIPGHAAESAGLQNRDIITGLEGNPLEALGSPDLVARNLERDLYRRSVGETVSLTIQRDSQRRTVSLTLEPMPKLPGEAPRFYHRQLGVVLREKVMLDRYLDKGPTANVDGMLVENVTRSGPAHQAGLQQGDVVTAVNGRPVTTAEGLKQIVDAATSQSPPQELRMDIQRGTATQTVVVRPPRS